MDNNIAVSVEHGARGASRNYKVLDDPQELAGIFAQQKKAYAAHRFPTFQERKDKLKRLASIIKNNQAQIIEAVSEDFGNRASQETRLVEIVSSLAEIKHILSHLKKWIKPERRSTSIWFLPGSNFITPQPVGVVGIMAPWNYPINLAVAPLAAAIAAGNRAMVRMSEYTPKTAALFARLIAEEFDATEIAVFCGNAGLAAEFSSLPFDHLLFTGSTAVGKKVMASAAANLTPVTLELGGKSPVIVAQDYNVEEAAERIGWGKTFNAGQTCVAPDYVFVPEDKASSFVEAILGYFNNRYTAQNSQDYTTVVNDGFYDRLTTLVDEAEKSEAQVFHSQKPATDDGGQDRSFPLTVVVTNDENIGLAKEEIFGPVLLVRTYENLTEVVEFINKGERPLGLYLFSNSAKTKDLIQRETISGGVAFNDVMLQYLQVDMPFGGVGASGFGKYHGKEGFETFSNMKPVFQQRGIGKFTGLKTLYPPYGKLSNTMIKLMGG